MPDACSKGSSVETNVTWPPRTVAPPTVTTPYTGVRAIRSAVVDVPRMPVVIVPRNSRAVAWCVACWVGTLSRDCSRHPVASSAVGSRMMGRCVNWLAPFWNHDGIRKTPGCVAELLREANRFTLSRAAAIRAGGPNGVVTHLIIGCWEGGVNTGGVAGHTLR